jgi:hypothetical protein
MPSTQIDLGDEGLTDGDQIDNYLADYFESGAEVHIPSGDYEWHGGGLSGGYADAALIGDGDPGSVRLHHPEGEHRYNAVHASSGEVLLKNLTIRGAQGGQEGKLRAEARDPDARMVLEQVWQPDGNIAGHDPEAVGFYVGKYHTGEVVFRECYAEGFADNGLYASNPGTDGHGNGRVVVDGGLYRNNNITNLRLGSDNSVARGVTLVHDAEAPENEGAVNQRNLRIRQPGENITIEHCDIYHSRSSYWPIELSSYLNDKGSGVIRNTRVYTKSGRPVVSDHNGGWRVESIDLTGSGNHSLGIPAETVKTGVNAVKAASAPRVPIWTYEARDGATPAAPATDRPDASTSGGSPTEARDHGDDETATLAFVTEAGTGRSDYAFTTTGAVTPIAESVGDSPAGNPVRATSNFEVQSLANGYVYVAGHTGNGYGDAYAVSGRIVSLDAPDDMRIELGGEVMAAADVLTRTCGLCPAGNGGGDGAADDDSGGDNGTGGVSLSAALARLRRFYQSDEAVPGASDD